MSGGDPVAVLEEPAACPQQRGEYSLPWAGLPGKPSFVSTETM